MFAYYIEENIRLNIGTSHIEVPNMQTSLIFLVLALLTTKLIKFPINPPLSAWIEKHEFIEIIFTLYSSHAKINIDRG